MCILVPPLSFKLHIFMNLHTFGFFRQIINGHVTENLWVFRARCKKPPRRAKWVTMHGSTGQGRGGGVWIPPVENSNFLNSNSEITKLGIGLHFSFENKIKYFLDTPPLKKMLDPRFNDTRDVYTTQGRIYLSIHPWPHVQLNQVRIYYSSICKIVQTMGTNCRCCGKWNPS